MHNFLKYTIAKFTFGSPLEWDDILPLATYCFNIAPLVDDLESPFYLVACKDALEGRLSNLQNYCRYVGDQNRPASSAELRDMWKLHASYEENRIAEPAQNKKLLRHPISKWANLLLEHWPFLFDRTYQLLIDKLSCSNEHFIRSENNHAILTLYVLLSSPEHA